MSFNTIPIEIFIKILSYIPIEECYPILLVNKEWNREMRHILYSQYKEIVLTLILYRQSLMPVLDFIWSMNLNEIDILENCSEAMNTHKEILWEELRIANKEYKPARDMAISNVSEHLKYIKKKLIQLNYYIATSSETSWHRDQKLMAIVTYTREM